FDQSSGGAAAVAAAGAGASEQTGNTVVDLNGVQSTSSSSAIGEKSAGVGERRSSAGCPGEVKLPGAGSRGTTSPTGSQQSTGCLSDSSPTGSQRTTGCVGSSSPSGSQRTTGCVGSSSPSGSQRTSGCVGSSSPSGSQRTTGCAESSSPAGSPRTPGYIGEGSPSAGISRLTGFRGSTGGKVGTEVALRSRGSPPILRPTAGVVFRSAPGGSGGTNQRPLSTVGDIVVNPLRQSFLLADDEELPEVWREQDQSPRSCRDRSTTFTEGGLPKHTPREDQHKYPGVRFSLPPREMPSYPGGRRPLHGSPREEGYYQGMRPKLREAESSPDIRSPYSPREERGFSGIRSPFSPRDERSYLGGFRAAEFSPKEERIFSGFRQFSPKDDSIYNEDLRLQSSPRDCSYPGPLPHQSSRDDLSRPHKDSRDDLSRPRHRDDPNYPTVRPHRYSYIGVRVQHPPREQLRHSYPTVHRPYPATRGTGTYPGVRPGSGTRGSRTDAHYPVDQLIKATETVV
ncbi:hypothetical protein OTU49_005071, partial [Cherax quadricarinatus]